MIEVSAIPAFRDNYIWALSNDQGEVVVVDPGEAKPVEHHLDQRGQSLVGILITHHHPDHVGGVTSLASRGDVPVWGPARERIPGRTTALTEGDQVTIEALDGLSLEVFDVPGHTAGHIAYYGGGMLFAGDALFAGGCGRLFEGTPGQMRASLAKLRSLPPETQLYCGHEYTQANLAFAMAVEPNNEALRARHDQVTEWRSEGRITLPSSLATELATNPFLRWDEPSVQAAAASHAGANASSADEVFAVIRSWKDSF
jgi:hydroxyacylglutathione hydrolase